MELTKSVRACRIVKDSLAQKRAWTRLKKDCFWAPKELMKALMTKAD